MAGENRPVDSPRTLLWAVWLLYLESAGLVGLTGVLVYLDLTSGALHLGMAVALTVLAALAAAAVFFVARGLGRRISGYRGPAVVVQLFLIAAGGFLVQVEPRWLGVVLIALGALTGLLVLVPASSRALGVD